MIANFYGPDLADLHNLHYADYVEKASPGVAALLRDAGIAGGVVLDLGCGGGQLSQHLLRHGYSPVCVDVSAAMIRLARQRLQGTKAAFIRGSIASARFPHCAAAIGVGEVFNYLPSPTVMKHAFRNVYRALNPGGLLVFDVKEPLSLTKKAIRSSARWGRDWAILVEVVEDARHRRLARKIVTFIKTGSGYRRHDEVHRQILYRAADLALTLRKIGFTVGIATSYGMFRLSPDRKILIARKPATPAR